jgi:hypothetical protein
VWPRLVQVLSNVEVLSESDEEVGRAKGEEGDRAQNRTRGDAGKSGKRQRPDECNDTGGKNRYHDSASLPSKASRPPVVGLLLAMQLLWKDRLIRSCF